MVGMKVVHYIFKQIASEKRRLYTNGIPLSQVSSSPQGPTASARRTSNT